MGLILSASAWLLLVADPDPGPEPYAQYYPHLTPNWAPYLVTHRRSYDAPQFGKGLKMVKRGQALSSLPPILSLFILLDASFDFPRQRVSLSPS